MPVDNACMASPKIVFRGGEGIHGQWPKRITGKHEETKSLEKIINQRKRKGKDQRKRNGKEERREKIASFSAYPSATIQVRAMLLCCLKPSIHGHVLILIKVDSDKEQNCQKHLQTDLAILATLLLLSLSYVLPM
jgi:hypothetical protein